MSLAKIIAASDAILLDFDGPVADLFPAGSGTRIAADTRTPIRRAGVAIPAPVASVIDHLAVLEFAAAHAPAALEAAEYAAVAGEVQSARTAPLTPGASEFLKACGETGRAVAIVSNNAAAAIGTFLGLHGLSDYVAFVLGRPFARPDLMKPDPGSAAEALQLLGTTPDRACVVGDAVTDIEFAHRAGLTAIGYAKNEKRGRELADAGAYAIVHTMAELADAVCAAGPV
jgi:HAD superfamily hydrolase (TIGR01509 family)